MFEIETVKNHRNDKLREASKANEPLWANQPHPIRYFVRDDRAHILLFMSIVLSPIVIAVQTIPC